MPLIDRFKSYFFLVLAVFAAYANVYHNQFLFDDLSIIVENAFLREWKSFPDLVTNLTITGSGRAGGFYRPLQMMLYFFLYQSFGLSTVAFHGMNVILQAANTALVYRLGCRLGFQARAAFAAALLWGVHPLWTETVACASGTADLLLVFFTLSGLLVLLPGFATRKIWLAGAFLVLALGSKESAAVFPALATFTLFLVSDDRLRPATYVRTWPLWLLSAVYIAAWTMNPNVSQIVYHDPQDMFYNQFYEHNIVNRILTSLATLPTYFGLMLWPADLHMERSFPIFANPRSWQVLLGAAMVAAALLQIFRGKGLALSWGLLWFAAALSPNTGILKALYAMVSEHWIYLPAIGLFLGVAQTAVVWLDRQKSKKLPMIVAAVVALAALSLGAKTYFQNRLWHDPVALYGHILKYGENGRAHINLGDFYFRQGDYEKAEEHFRAVIARPAPVWQSLLSTTHMHLALIYLGARLDENGMITGEEVARVLPLTHRLPEAVAELEKVLELDPNAYWAKDMLTAIRNYQGNKETNADN